MTDRGERSEDCGRAAEVAGESLIPCHDIRTRAKLALPVSRLENAHRLRIRLRTAFPVSVRFGHLEVFEAENIIAMLMPPQFGVEEFHLLVEVWRPIPLNRIPDCILAHTKNGGCFHGMFAPESPVAG